MSVLRAEDDTFFFARAVSGIAELQPGVSINPRVSLDSRSHIYPSLFFNCSEKIANEVGQEGFEPEISYLSITRLLEGVEVHLESFWPHTIFDRSLSGRASRIIELVLEKIIAEEGTLTTQKAETEDGALILILDVRNRRAEYVIPEGACRLFFETLQTPAS